MEASIAILRGVEALPERGCRGRWPDELRSRSWPRRLSLGLRCAGLRGDLAYVQQDRTETSVLLELFSARYERRSRMITANQPFGQWNRVYSDETTAVAAVDRLVHHATILEMTVESYRRRAAFEYTRRKRARPANLATERNTGPD